jgi:hypothetical protein
MRTRSSERAGLLLVSLLAILTLEYGGIFVLPAGIPGGMPGEQVLLLDWEDPAA